ncbi:MAG: hybrid sensor histidine kinase/response regulator [Deltaproteobacteria bacterium]|nr:hybrid sensor histidine kinase/response regulator [Deltaproteobacteria bacterium]
MSADNEKNEILLVDDEADIRDVLAIALEDLGYDVLAAVNGEEALRIFKTRSPSLVLTDIKMPHMDGIELLKRIKQENPECEVIMITGHGDMNLAIKSLKHEATDFITKPINVDALEISLKRAEDKIVVREKLKAYTRSLEALIREKTELQDNLSALGLMIGSISHGIKGLITGLDGGIYLVNAGIEKKDLSRIQEGWDIILTMIDRIRKLAEDILLQAKEREPEMRPVDLPSFAGEVAQIIAPKMEKHGIDFICDFEADAGAGILDARYITTALVNILENAVDACVKDIRNKNKRITFGLETDNRHVRFTIHDNGIGMDLETREKIFSLFYSSKGRKGTGLGLFIAHKIIGQHDGGIHVDSMPGQGAKFTVKLPRKPAR